MGNERVSEGAVRITDVGPVHLDEFCRCLSTDSEDALQGAPRRWLWVEVMRQRGLRAKIALDDTERAIGMIQYLPAGEALIDGPDLYFIQCIWVPPKDASGSRLQGHGVGTMLLSAAEEDARALGANGMAAWGLRLPIWMRASWFCKHGYHRVDHAGITSLVFKAFTPDAVAPRLTHAQRRPDPEPGCVKVTCLVNGWCCAANAATERARLAAEDLGDPVVFEEFDTTDPAVARQWGALDAVFIDDKKVWTGPPPSYAKLRRKIERRTHGVRTPT